MNSFWYKVLKIGNFGGCWIWMGAKNKQGYGNFKFKGKTYLAHRFSFFLFYNVFPSKLALHKCDNPSCVRPSHLFEGTHKNNMDDMYAKGRDRKNVLKGIKHPKAKLTEANVKEIRYLYSLQIGWTQKLLATKFKVSQTIIHDTIHSIHYATVK